MVPDESASTDWIRLGAADLIDLPLDRVALVDALETHASPVDSMTGEVPVTRSAAVPTAWMGPMVAVTGTSGGGASTVAAALAQGLSADARHARQVVLADLARTATRDVEVGGMVVPEGRKVMLLYGSANRDERQYGADAGELDVTRRPRNILTFSHGAHHCLGAAAARMQARIALTELLARCPDFEVDESGIVWAGGGYVRRPLSVPFRVVG